MKLQDLINYFENFAPQDAQEDWDNAGLQVGDPDKEINTIVIALDPDSRALEYCIEKDADLLITHHPLLFNSFKRLSTKDPDENKILRFIKNDIAVFSMHTNIDKMPWGTNFALADELNLSDYILEEPLLPEYELSSKTITAEFKAQFNQKIPGFISLVNYSTDRFSLMNLCEENLEAPVKVNFEDNAKADLIAISGGSFDKDWIDKVYKAGVDTIICGEMKYHDGVDCRERGIAVLDLGHDVSENPVTNVFRYLLDTYVHYINHNNEDDTEINYNPEIYYYPRLKKDIQ